MICKIISKYIIFLLAVIVLFSCVSVATKLYKTGEKFEAKGNHTLASDQYEKALKNDPDHVKSKLGLTRVSPEVLKFKTREFNKLYNSNDFYAAYYKIEDIEQYKKRMNLLGLEFSNILYSYNTKFSEVKNFVLEDSYNKGIGFFDEGLYDKSISSLKLAVKINPSYKDASDFLSKANKRRSLKTAEEYYKKGLSAFESSEYKKAYLTFQKCNSLIKKIGVNDYKDLRQIMAIALKKGIVKLSVFKFKNSTNRRYSNTHNKVSSYIESAVSKCGAPFIKIIDRQNIDKIISEQKLNLSGLIDDETSTKAGKLSGVDYLITGELTNERVSVTHPYGVTNQAYMTDGTYVDGNGTRRYNSKKVSYRVYKGSSKAVVEVQYKITSLKTGETVVSKAIEKQKEDKILYATVDNNVDFNNLLINDPQGKAIPKTFFGKILDELSSSGDDYVKSKYNFKGRRKLKKKEELFEKISKDISNTIGNEICKKFNN